MKYRDHINTGVLFLPCFYFLESFGLKIFPFINYCCSGQLWENFLLYVCYFAGLSFPDIDVNFYGRGHRVRSPFHDILNVSACCILSILIAVIFRHTLALQCLNGFAYGCLFHLVGDLIQGGVGLRHKRIGWTKFSWDLYTETIWGKCLSLFLTLISLAVMGLTYKYVPARVSGPIITVFTGSFMFSSYYGALGFYLTVVVAAFGIQYGVLDGNIKDLIKLK